MENRLPKTPGFRGPLVPQSLVQDIHQMIQEARTAVALTVNATLTRLYWRIGRRIQAEILRGGRAEYGEQILATLSQELTQEYSSRFAQENLHGTIQFVEALSEGQNVVSPIRQLRWTHSVALAPLAMRSAKRLLEHREDEGVGDAR